MTPSLPLPDEQPPATDAESGVDSQDAATPPRPRRAPRSAAKDPATTAPRRTPRTSAARSSATTRTAAGKNGAARKPAAKRPSPPRAPRTIEAVDPGPPPPLPADVVVPPDLVIPPKPPLPPVAPEAEPVEAEIFEPDAEVIQPEPQIVVPHAEIAESDVIQPEVTEPEVTEPEAEVTEPEVVEPEVLESAAEPIADAQVAPAAMVLLDDDAVAEVEGDLPALRLRGVTKTFGETRAVDGIDLTVPAGSFYGLVGPNGAGKTTTLSMIAGLLRPDSGTIEVGGIDAGRRRADAQRRMGVLPDRLRTFDRLTGRQLLYYYGVLRGLSSAVAESRTNDLARAFDLVDALGRPVSDYSAGMTKKVMLAGAMIHSPRVLVLDEPFESVDPVSSAVILDILSTYVEHGGTVILSSHGMQLVERVCTRVAVLVSGTVLVEGTVDDVRGTSTLEERFLELVGGRGDLEGLEWLHTFSD